MNAFTIDSDNNITVHATRKAARNTGAGVFDTAENLAGLIGTDTRRLVAIWNSLTGVTPVKKFTSRAVAARRIFAELQKLAVPVARNTKESRSTMKAATATKAGSKKEILLGLISRTNGASLEELMAALDWQKHSVRGLIATLGKMVNIESFKNGHGVRRYKTSQRDQSRTKS